jgi:hypothetical protein
MADLDELYPGRFLKARTLERPMTIRIVSVTGEPLKGDDDKEQLKGVLKYRTADGFGEAVWCRTNALLTAAVIGTRDYSTWPGHYITIHFDPTVRFGNDTPGGIRVFGSPELKKAIAVEIKRPRRRTPEKYTLQPTDKDGRVREGKPAPPENKPAPTATALTNGSTIAHTPAADEGRMRGGENLTEREPGSDG